MRYENAFGAVDFEPALAFLETNGLRERARRWLQAMVDRGDFWHTGGAAHMQGHWTRVLVHALSVGAHEGLSDEDLDALCAAATFHDTRRKSPLYDVGHGSRAAAHYQECCDRESLAFDERAYLAMSWHDRDDIEGEQAISEWAEKRKYGTDWMRGALTIYRIFKDADGLDRVRLGNGGPNESFLRLDYTKERIAFAWELLYAFPFSSYEKYEMASTNALSAATGLAVNKLYLQAIERPLPPQDTEDPQRYAGKIEKLKELIDDADSVVIGIGSGMSTASGYDFYHSSGLFDYAFEQFRKAHGFGTLYDGLYHVFSTHEEQWAFTTAVAEFCADIPLGRPYRQLASLMEGKDHFVITTNVDGQVPRAFGDDRCWLFQGDMRLFQCSQPCHDGLVEGEDLLLRLLSKTRVGDDGIPRIPTDELPRCSHCGHLLTPWVRDENFLEGIAWKEGKRRYEDFVIRHLEADSSVLFLELGVSSMTPSIIKLPFWDMKMRNDNAYYVSVNMADVETPLQLDDRALAVTADLAKVMRDLS